MITPYSSLHLVDTHTHFYHAFGTPEMDELMQRCAENGVQQMLLPNVDHETVDSVLGLANAYPEQCFPMMGLHPCHVTPQYEQQLAELLQVLEQNPMKAVGEIGLDLYWQKDNLADQQQAFRMQAAWAIDRNLPVSIHCREAYEPLFELLEEDQLQGLRGILHCFTGTQEQGEWLINKGFLLGIGGVVTYKKGGLAEVVEQLPLNALVLETDAPYLAPVPYRGKRNESSYLLYIAQKIADLHGIPLETVAEVTTANAKRVFDI
jgi:TatD DNase family protein